VLLALCLEKVSPCDLAAKLSDAIGSLIQQMLSVFVSSFGLFFHQREAFIGIWAEI